MTDRTQEVRREHLSDTSETLLNAIDELHALETSKREELVSTPPFHELAAQIQRRSKAVFDMATDQVAQADRLETTTVSLDDVGASHTGHDSV